MSSLANTSPESIFTNTNTDIFSVASGGAPPDACTSLTPGHGEQARDHGDITYRIQVVGQQHPERNSGKML